MDLELLERGLDGYVVVELRGELDLSNASGLRARLMEVLAGESASLILDLSGLAFMDSTGVSVLVAAERRAIELGGTISLAGAQKVVARVLRVTSMDKHFATFGTVEEAVLAGRHPEPPVAAT